MLEAAASEAGAALETSAERIENSFGSTLDSSFVERKLEDSEKTWSGENLDMKKHHIQKVENSSAHEQLNNYGWSPEVIRSIKSVKEAEIYKEANLQEGVINDRPCLQNPGIDWEQRTPLDSDVAVQSRGGLPFGFGKLDGLFSISNKERAMQGLPPLDSKGQAFELHHVGQRMDSPLAELTFEQHRGAGNDAVLHEKTAPSQIDRCVFQTEKRAYWKARAEMLN
jgi:hypothetical protein